MTDVDADGRIEKLRARVDAADRAILESLNERVAIVDELRRHKQERGIAFVDPAREEQLLDRLVRENGGPLSSDGVVEVFRTILARTKREVYGDRA